MEKCYDGLKSLAAAEKESLFPVLIVATKKIEIFKNIASHTAHNYAVDVYIVLAIEFGCKAIVIIAL